MAPTRRGSGCFVGVGSGCAALVAVGVVAADADVVSLTGVGGDTGDEQPTTRSKQAQQIIARDFFTLGDIGGPLLSLVRDH
ncbi:MAG: hypothetical protein AMJ93_07785 [Anaerolineae bacterium SM23_84]|nr:MAG: hypothetical protein AMJ93_07785 [Anaerolineae bacterium SM23_84]